MAKLDAAYVVSSADYEVARPEYRRRVSAERQRRRMRLGEGCSLQFETQEFALWHVQELLRVEGWSLPRATQTVRDVEPWCPGRGDLVATVMVDTDDSKLAQRVTRALARPGVIRLCAGQHVLRSEVLEAGFPADPIWYLRWPVTPQWCSALAAGGTCTTSWDGARYPLSSATSAALREDITSDPASQRPLLHCLVESRDHHVPQAGSTGTRPIRLPCVRSDRP